MQSPLIQEIIMHLALKFAVIAPFLAAAPALAAEEFNIGAEVVQNGIKIVPNYLTGIEMEPMPRDMAMGPESIHLEADIHAAKGEPHGFSENEWMPYVSISYTIEKVGGAFRKTGTLLPMTAGDGPHYAANLDMDGPGQYHLTYHIDPPSKAGFIRHTDKATGVPPWWAPFDASWTFTYPAKPKKD
jgi:periplasmic iron binding protein